LNQVVHFGDRETPVVNLRGEKLFDAWSDIFRARPMMNVPLYSFNRRNVFEDNLWREKRIWHGSDASGTRSESGYCNAWRSGDKLHVGSSSPLGPGMPLLDGCQNIDCSHEFAILCVEVSDIAL
uniref:CLE-1C protein (inferred by orthology to a C. elegans protein) n=1 Tax=Anisakis simplex TaxID=6269 RepID=A0A0M3KH96_ANISI